MQTHQHIPQGFIYFVDIENVEEIQLSDRSIHDEFDWDECEPEYAEDSNDSNLLNALSSSEGYLLP